MPWQKIVPQGPPGEKGEPGKDGNGTVNSVNQIEPDEFGDVTLPVPEPPDLSGLATKGELQSVDGKVDSIYEMVQPVTGLAFNLVGGVDLDALLETGVYRGGSSMLEAGTYLFIVYNHGGSSTPGVTQYIIGENVANQGLLFTRTRNAAGIWSPLYKYVTSKLPARTNATLAAGWTNAGSSYQPLSFYKDQFGVVCLEGVVIKGSSAGNQVTTLPVGMRPPKTMIFYANYQNGVMIEINIEPSGAVTVSGGVATISINASFRTD